jgi:hypothetical protein
MTIQYWDNNPMILFLKEHMKDIWPMQNMSNQQKMTAMTRFIILATILGYIITQNRNLFVVGIITYIIICFINAKTHQPKLTRNKLMEGFSANELLLNENNSDLNSYETVDDNDKILNPVTLKSVLKSEFKEGTKKNPFSNVLLTEISDSPNRLSAPPSFAPAVEDKITKDIKKSVQYNNPEIKNTDKQLFGDLYENWELDQNSRSYYSTPNTQIANDQGAFSQYLYGSLFSSKESNPMGNLQREKDNLFTSHYNLY